MTGTMPPSKVMNKSFGCGKNIATASSNLTSATTKMSASQTDYYYLKRVDVSLWDNMSDQVSRYAEDYKVDVDAIAYTNWPRTVDRTIHMAEDVKSVACVGGWHTYVCN